MSADFGTIFALAPRLADGSESAENLVSTCLSRIAAGDADIKAILRLDPSALTQAVALDAERRRTGVVRGRLHGIPLVVKDNIDVAGLPTSSGNLAMAGAMPFGDSEQVRRMRAAGAVILGKANLSEFSFEIRSRSSIGGDVRNPFNHAVTAGGSSGGSAAAVAAGFAVAALGTDTGGSIRVPAAYNGLVGLRPTHGVIDMAGIAPLAPSTDTVGPLARCVADVTVMLGVMTDMPTVVSTRRLRGARIGVLRQAFGEDAEIGATMERALKEMAEAGAVLIDPVVFPERLLPAGRPHVVDWEFGAAFDAYLDGHFVPGTAPGSLAEIVASGAYLPEYRETLAHRIACAGRDAPEYWAIMAYHREVKAALGVLLDGLDALVYPTSMVTPKSLENPPGGWAPELAANSGFPALTLPIGQAQHGPFIGLEFIAHAGAEHTLLGLGADLENCLARSRT